MCCLGWYVIGVISGICGPGAIAATTIAVDSVFISHLQKQLVALRGNDPAAVSAIFAIAAEEQQHHDRSESHVQVGSLWSMFLTPLVSASTEEVI